MYTHLSPISQLTDSGNINPKPCDGVTCWYTTTQIHCNDFYLHKQIPEWSLKNHNFQKKALKDHKHVHVTTHLPIGSFLLSFVFVSQICWIDCYSMLENPFYDLAMKT